ncbi:PREDICTED: zinc finger CCHC domain-containing protein 9-like [Miniopterus natalensis]|uniref:zinc finger CCHC domain-containing protein 9-like n=1 Tax=Miniopterus natalensis TaxID=291302 RepID=UPI0007A70B98|nr:PREDICTED: zinc finger CCHC domain-containing protein 9-like [Miniopterus natalensis]
MKMGSFEEKSQNLKSEQLEVNRLSLRNDAPQAKHKKNKKKKKYLNEYVNGFMDSLKQNSQMVHNGEIIAIDSQEGREEIAVALKKDSLREGRRLKRQAAALAYIYFFFTAMVCFHCRKHGHGIADCPAALENQDMDTRICYPCGSTEQEITKCKAKVDPALGEFPFAKCFVCREMRHLSRSCPDNPTGVYADGSCSTLCGSVRHFKDCPQSQNSDQMLTVGRWAKGMNTDYEEI